MARLTTWDRVRGVYVIKPDASGNHIQKLGRLEDRDEVHRLKRGTVDHEIEYECGACNAPVLARDMFCVCCGQRLKWGE